MRKTTFLLVALFIILAVLLPANAPTRSESRPNAGPEFPFPVLGIVKFNGFYISIEDEVLAQCGTYIYGPAMIQIEEGKSWYSMDIPGDDPGTAPVKEGCVNGEPITFTIKGETAEQTANWESSETTVLLDLSFGTPNMVFLPMIRR